LKTNTPSSAFPESILAAENLGDPLGQGWGSLGEDHQLEHGRLVMVMVVVVRSDMYRGANCYSYPGACSWPKSESVPLKLHLAVAARVFPVGLSVHIGWMIFMMIYIILIL
jgi:hypothetical protein